MTRWILMDNVFAAEKTAVALIALYENINYVLVLFFSFHCLC